MNPVLTFLFGLAVMILLPCCSIGRHLPEKPRIETRLNETKWLLYSSADRISTDTLTFIFGKLNTGGNKYLAIYEAAEIKEMSDFSVAGSRIKFRTYSTAALVWEPATYCEARHTLKYHRGTLRYVSLKWICDKSKRHFSRPDIRFERLNSPSAKQRNIILTASSVFPEFFPFLPCLLR